MPPYKENSTENLPMDAMDSSGDNLSVRETARVRTSHKYLRVIVTCAVFIVIMHLGHAIGLLYAEQRLMVNTGQDYSPDIYLEAIPAYLMVFLLFIPLMLYRQWKSYILGPDPDPKDYEDFKPVILILAFIHSVVFHVIAYIAQILVILIQVYIRHRSRISSGDRCKCFHGDLQYLVQTLSIAQAHQCVCYLPSLPDHSRTVQLITDDVSRLTPSNLERYTGEVFDDPTTISVTEYATSVEYQQSIATETFSTHYTTVIFLVMCHLVILASRLAMWVKVKQLWTESEKVHLATQLTSSTDSLRGVKKPSFKTIVTAACEANRILKKLDKTFEERSRSNIRMAIDEFTFAFLEGIDAFSLYLEMLQYAYVKPDSALLDPAIFFICVDLVVVNMVNSLLAIPVHGERISGYTKATGTIVTGIPFIVIRLYIYSTEGRIGFPVLALALFLMKEFIGVLLSILEIIHMARYDCRKRTRVSTD